LVDYPTENVEERHIKKLKEFTEDERFNKDTLKSVNLVAANLAGWVLAM